MYLLARGVNGQMPGETLPQHPPSLAFPCGSGGAALTKGRDAIKRNLRSPPPPEPSFAMDMEGITHARSVAMAGEGIDQGCSWGVD